MDITPKQKADYLQWLMPDVYLRFIKLKIQEWEDTDEPSILGRTYTKEFWLTVLDETSN